MSQILPWIALVLAVCAVLLRPKSDRPRPPAKEGRTEVYAIGTAFLLALLAWVLAGALAPDATLLRSAASAFFVGLFLVRLERLAARRFGTLDSAPWALGVGAFVAGIGEQVVGPSSHGVVLAMVAGLALGTVGASTASWMPLAAFAVASVDLLGGLAGEGNLGTAGQMIVTALAIAAVLSNLGEGQLKENRSALRPWITAILATAACVLVAETYLGIANAMLVLAVAGGAALVTHFSIRTRGETFGFLLACLIWLGMATFAFGFLKGFGMAIAWTAAIGVLMPLGNRRAMLATGPLATLVAYRLFREYQKEATRAFDIGQHYAIVGLVLAVGLALMLLEFGRTADPEPSPIRAALGLDLGLLGAIALQICGYVLLAAKGAVGFQVGTGMAPVVAGLRGDDDEHALVLALGFACLSPVLYTLLADKLDLARDDKRSFLIVGVLVVAVTAVVAFLVTPRKSDSPSS